MNARSQLIAARAGVGAALSHPWRQRWQHIQTAYQVVFSRWVLHIPVAPHERIYCALESAHAPLIRLGA